MEGTDRAQASSSLHVRCQTEGVLVFDGSMFLSPEQMGAECQRGVLSPDGLRWTLAAPLPQRRWGSQQLLGEENCQRNDKGISRKQITVPLHTRGRKCLTGALGANAKQAQEGESSFRQKAGY